MDPFLFGILLSDMKLKEDDYQNILTHALSRGKDQRKLLTFLREHTFVMVSPTSIKELELPLELKVSHRDYSFMVRRISDLDFDTYLSFGFKMHGKRRNKVLVYLGGKHTETLFLEGFNDNVNFAKIEKVWVFPDDTMPSYKDRQIWRAENKKVLRNNGHTPSAWYLEHAEKIFNLSGLTIPEHIIDYLRERKKNEG